MSGNPISIVVPTYNRLSVLQQTLPTYLAQGMVQEVVVVNDGGVDGTAQWLTAKASQNSKLRLLNLKKNGGSPAARNAGIRSARGDWILLVDDDILLAPDYAVTLLEHAREQGFDLASGRRLWLRPNESRGRAEERLAKESRAPLINAQHFLFNDCALTASDTAVSLIQAVMLIRKEVFSKVRYDSVFVGNAWREETDFQLSALEAGYRVGFCPHTVCFHTPKQLAGNGGGQRAGNRLQYEWHLIANNYRFLKKHRPYLSSNHPEVVRGPLWWRVTRAYLEGRVLDKARRVFEEAA